MRNKRWTYCRRRRTPGISSQKGTWMLAQLDSGLQNDEGRQLAPFGSFARRLASVRLEVFELTAGVETHLQFPFLVVEARQQGRCPLTCRELEQVCSTTWSELVHLQENLCINAVVRASTYA
jgi:hypothetical protein